MAASILDLNALFAPIPGFEPGGPNPKLVRDKDPLRDPTQLDKSRLKAVEDGHKLPVNDPSRIKLWRDVLKLTHDLFATRSKSLGWAVYLVDAAARTAGFAGAREGFQFLTRLTNEGWEWMWPHADPNDEAFKKLDNAEERASHWKEMQANALGARAGRYQSLDDSGLLFPNALREWIIAEADGVVVSANTCRGAEGKPAKVSSEELQAVARKLGPEKVREALDEIVAALADLEALKLAAEQLFTQAEAADQAPSFLEIKKALEDCRQVADEMLAAVEGSGEATPDTAAGETAAPGAPDAKGKQTRESLYRQLAQIADHFARLEPHSPVPLLLRRVIELQHLPFPELVRQFTQSGEAVIGFLERSLTAKPASGE